MVVKIDGNGILGKDTHNNLTLNGDGTVTFEQTADNALIKGNNLSDVASVAQARANLGLGSAATANVGVVANSVVQLDGSARLPAVDGSQLKNVNSGGIISLGAKTASGTQVIFTGIPSNSKRVTLSFAGLSINNTDQVYLQLGNSGGIVSSGYSGCQVEPTADQTTGGTNGLPNFIPIVGPNFISTDYKYIGNVVMLNLTGNLWVVSGFCGCVSSSISPLTHSYIDLGSPLSQIRIYPSVGNSFNGGTLNVFCE